MNENDITKYEVWLKENGLRDETLEKSKSSAAGKTYIKKEDLLAPGTVITHGTPQEPDAVSKTYIKEGDLPFHGAVITAGVPGKHDAEVDIVRKSSPSATSLIDDYTMWLKDNKLHDVVMDANNANTLDAKAAALAAAKAMPQDTIEDRAKRDRAISDAMHMGKEAFAPGFTPDPTAKDFSIGMGQTIMGVAATAADIVKYTGIGHILDKAGIDFEGLDADIQAKINYLKDSVKDKDIFSANTVGQILLPTLAMLPAHISKKITVAFLDGLVAYTMEQGAGASDSTSLLAASTAVGTSFILMSFLERYNGTTALNDVVTNLSKGKDTNKIYRDFAKYTGKEVESMSNHDKVVAIVASSGEEGAITLLKMAARDSKLKKSIDALMESPNNVVVAALEGNNIARTVRSLREQSKFAKTAYNTLEQLAIAYPTANINIGPARQSLIDELMSIPELKRSAGINKVLSTLQKENLSMSDILDMRKYLNGINFKASRIDSKIRESISAVDYLDSIVDANLPAEFKQVFSEARSELALSYALQGKNAKKAYNNKFSSLAMEIGKGNETYSSILDKLVSASGGTKKFNELHRGLGYEQAKEFELGLIREIQAAKGENLGLLLDKIKDLGFVTPEARDMTKRIRMLDKAFSSADFYNATTRAAITGGLDGASITNDFLSKVTYTVTGNIWNAIKPYVLPFGDAASQERMFRRVMTSVEKGLKNDTKAINLEQPHSDMYKDFQPIIRRTIEESIQNKLDTIKGLSNAKMPTDETKLLRAPANFTVRADGTIVKASGDKAQDILSREPTHTTVEPDSSSIQTGTKTSDDIIEDVEWWEPTSTVITPDGHIISMEELLRAENLPDNMRLPEKATIPIKNFFDMKYKMKTDPDLIKAREEVKTAATPDAKSKAKDRLVKLLEYIKLRDEGMSPKKAHSMTMQSSAEIGGALAGGTMNGITIDDDGNIQVDAEKFLIGAAGGVAAVKGGKALGKYIDEGNELMRQQAGGGTPPNIDTIRINYKLDDVLNSVDDRQKFTAAQLKSFLLNKNVTENEIKTSKILDAVDNGTILTAREWKQKNSDLHHYAITEYKGLEAPYSEITLGTGGIGNDTYKVKEYMMPQDKEHKNTNLMHYMDTHTKFSEEPQAYDKLSQLGWIRTHVVDYKGKPTTVVNEIQSDWMQAERQRLTSDGKQTQVFAKNAKPADPKLIEERNKAERIYWDAVMDMEDYELDARKLYGDDWNNKVLRNRDWQDIIETMEDTYKRFRDIQAEVEKKELRVIRDFPMRQEKFRQLMLVDSINEAITNKTNKVIIPIHRGGINKATDEYNQGKELYGNENVTKVYKNMIKDINIVADKLKKQGYEILVGKDNYISKGLDYGTVADLLNKEKLDELLEYIAINDPELLTKIKPDDFYNYKVGNKPIMEFLLDGKHFEKYTNEVYTIEIKPQTGGASWDMYGILGTLGLTEIADAINQNTNTDK